MRKGAISSVKSFEIRAGIIAGPDALLGLIFLSRYEGLDGGGSGIHYSLKI